MHTQPLPLDLFVKVESLYHSNKFAGRSVFDLLGKNLQHWLASLLNELEVSNRPVILGRVHPQAIIEGSVFVDEGAEIEATALVRGPCYIGKNAEVRHGAYIRGNCYIGPDAVVGHATEAKGAIFMDHAKAGHFAYVGDSILGVNCNLGAGTKVANLKLNHSPVTVVHPISREKIKTELKKLGAVIGDQSQIGCNAVLSPGSLLMPKSLVLPCSHHVGTTKLAN